MNERLTEIEKQITQLELEKEKLLNAQKEETYKKNWDTLTTKILNYPIKDMMTVVLREDTKTIPIFDEFQKSSKPFLLINNIGILSLKTGNMPGPYGGYNFFKEAIYSLILCKSWNRLYVHNSSITPTKLKKALHLQSLADINDATSINNSSYIDNAELRPLWDEINSTIFVEFANSVLNGKDLTDKISIFSKPILIGAQTTKNREGYGNIYHGEELIYEGTKYGDTTKFLIAGVVLNTL